MILPPRTTTAPTGTSPALAALLARRNASRMKYSSFGGSITVQVVLAAACSRTLSKQFLFVLRLVCSPLPFKEGERIEVRGFWNDAIRKWNLHPPLSLWKPEAKEAR